MVINYEKFIDACSRYDVAPKYIYRFFPPTVKKGIVTGGHDFQPKTVGDICACIGCTPEEITDKCEHRKYVLPLPDFYVELDENKVFLQMAKEGLTYDDISDRAGVQIKTIKGSARMATEKAIAIAKALYCTLDDILWKGEKVC